VSEIFLDCRREPGGHDVQIDRPRSKPQPQRPETSGENNADRRQYDRSSSDPGAGAKPTAKPAKRIRDAMNTDASPLEKFERPVARHIVMVIPIGIIPLPLFVGGLREGFRGLGTRHSLSVLVVSLLPPDIKATISGSLGQQHCCQSKIPVLVYRVMDNRPVPGRDARFTRLIRMLSYPPVRRNCPAEEHGLRFRPQF